MHLAIATVGTRGDVQPYAALGVELARRGVDVTFVTHEEHRGLVEAHGLGFRGVCGSFHALLRSPSGVRWLESADRPLEYLRALDALFAPLARSWMDDFHAALHDVDAALVHIAAMGAFHAVEARGVPHAILSPAAVLPSREVRALGLPRVPLLGGWLERAALGWALDRFWRIGSADVAAFRARHGVAPERRPWWRELEARRTLHLSLFSEHVQPRPRDWGAHAVVTGYCFLDALPGWTPPGRLLDFLAAGSPPVYVGFGSMTGMDPAALARLTHEALRRAGRRAVIGMGWGGLEGMEGNDDVLLVDDVPHDWLFPRVAAVVHHGGAGTTAAALRAGKPQVIVPFFADQPFWGRRMAEIGVAPAPVLKKHLTAERLAAAIAAAGEDAGLARRAETLGAAIAREDGTRKAADRVMQEIASWGLAPSAAGGEGRSPAMPPPAAAGSPGTAGA